MYSLARFFIRLALREYFSLITVRGKPLEDGPALIVGNHQNLALDSLLIASYFQRHLWSLGKSTLFDNPLLRPFLRSLLVLPLYRRQDAPGLASKNLETFTRVSELLRQDEAVLLFPEGVSIGDRALQPIKTGSARMAFQAESDGDFSVGVRVQPVGITYSDPTLFRSTVTVVFGEPLLVRDFRSIWEQDPREGVEQFTLAIEGALRAVSVSINDREHAQLVERIAWLYRAGGRGGDDFERFSIIAKNVERISTHAPVKRQEIEDELSRFEKLCSAMAVEPEDSFETIPRVTDPSYSLKMWLLAPAVLLAILVYRFPYRLIGRIVRRVCSDPVYIASTKFFLGMVIFPLWTLFLATLMVALDYSIANTVLICFGLVGSAVLANRFMPELRIWALSRFWPGTRSETRGPAGFLAREQRRLITKLEALRSD